MKSFAEFKETMKEEAFREEMASFMKEKKPQDKAAEIELIVAFAAEKGYAVTVEELGQEMAGNRELSEDEMESVAGGWCWFVNACDVVISYCFEWT